jgi:hypothetical protein
MATSCERSFSDQLFASGTRHERGRMKARAAWIDLVIGILKRVDWTNPATPIRVAAKPTTMKIAHRK